MPPPTTPRIQEAPLQELLKATFVLLFQTIICIIRIFLDALNTYIAEEKRKLEESVRKAQTAHATGVKPDFTSRRFVGLDALATPGGRSSFHSPAKPPPKRPTPHKTLWYDDGNIILASDRHLFRVYKGQLAQHSSVFRDMFSLPQVPPPSGTSDASGGVTDNDHWKGIPIVRMAGDSDNSITTLLMAVFHRSFFKTHETMCAPLFTSLLRMSTKYDFPAVRHDAVAYLAQVFPGQLDAFCERDARDFFAGYSSKLGDDFRLLAAARLHGATFSLPALFYMCARRTPEEIATFGARFLSNEDVRIALEGRKAAASFIESLRLHPRAPGYANHTRKVQCVAPSCPNFSRGQTYLSCVYDASQKRALRGPLEQTMKSPTFVHQETEELKTYCPIHREDAIRQNADDAKAFWQALPSFFQLPDWKNLGSGTQATA